ncbi:LysR family transcriptional regulator [Halobacillus halophilus]|uniref:LysR family transcriptional regulator n=1 Tax=Halobacillus halophilus TaxID=1570 RepID=UPI00136C17AB|nr:LysR family transcriptional regulator [Halobacillus halophilus]MYL31145.1 LysR family transcriptional regulator [Halobacillus halophilus]
MDIRHLQYFAEVAKQMSFTKAASTLHVSQPSLSKTVKQLETELGVPLFYRSKVLQLTDAGEAVLANAIQVLDAFHNLTAELDDITNVKKGKIRIGIPPITGAAFFSKIIRYYRDKYPEVDILLSEVGSKMIKQGVEDGSLDFGLVCNLPVESSQFHTLKVVDDPLMLLVHKDTSTAAKDIVHLGELQDEPFILYREDFTLHDRIIEECRAAGFQPNIVCHSSHRDFMMEMVEAKVGVALLPSQIAREAADKNIAVLSLSHPNLRLELGLVWKKNKYLAFSAREFISMSRDYVKETVRLS